MKGYESWSFWERPFGFALLLSLLWHFFWFFSVTVTVNPSFRKEKARPRVVSLGPVLDDTIFRTLAETKPQLSETFYRQMEDFSKPLDVKVKTIERREAGDVVSVPISERWGRFLKGVLAGEKAAPDYEFANRISLGYSSGEPELAGSAGSRRVLSRPDVPERPPGSDPFLKDTETLLGMTVKPDGSVTDIKVLESSGDPQVDLVWTHYLEQWRFAPLGVGEPAIDAAGRVRLRFRRAALTEAE